MKVGLVLPGFSRDAGDWAIPALQSLACRLAQDHELHIFSLRYPAAGRYRLCGLVHHAVGGGDRAGLRSLAYGASALRQIVAEHRRAPFALLHAFWLDEPALTAVIAARALGIPALASAGGGEMVYLRGADYGTWASPWRRAIIRLAMAGATTVTAGSNYARQLCLKQGTRPEKMLVAPLGVNNGHFRPAPLPSPAHPCLVQAASLSPVKNQALLLDIFTRIRAALPSAELLVAGEGPLQGILAREARERGVDGAVTWLGAVPHPRLAAVYRRAHLYLQSSLHESQGMALLEAMACGRPALGTPVGVLPDVTTATPSWRAAELAAQAVSLLQDESRLAAMGRKAAERVAEDYSLEAAAARFSGLYRRLTPAAFSL